MKINNMPCNCGHYESAHGSHYHENAPPGCNYCKCGAYEGKRMNEREEMEADKKHKASQRAAALSEAMRLLPIAESWAVFMVTPDGNPAIMISCPRYADAICIAHVGNQAMQKHISNFNEHPTQEI